MATYREIHGKAVKSVSTDPSAETDAGQIWYNTSSNTFKSIVGSTAWSSASPRINTLATSAGFGTQTSAVAAGGTSSSTTSEEYNGNGWSVGGTLNTGRFYVGGAGSGVPSGRVFGGRTAPTSQSVLNEEYDGTTWSETGGDLTTGRTCSGLGTKAAALAFGGSTGPGPSGGSNQNLSEEWNGTGWTEGPNLNTPRSGSAGAGTQTAGLCIAGQSTGNTNAVEEYNGVTWASVNDIPTGREGLFGWGTQDSAVAASGSSPYITTTFTYDGTDWSTSTATVGTAKQYGSSAGLNATAGLASGGEAAPGVVNTTEEFNSSANVITAAAWSAGGALPVISTGGAGMGTQTAAVYVGGLQYTPGGGATPPNKRGCYNYDGTSWTAQNNINYDFFIGSSAGTQTAGLAFGGMPGGSGALTTSSEYNGASWTSSPDTLGTAVQSAAGLGIQTNALCIGGRGDPPPSGITTVEEYDGTNWTTGTAQPTANYNQAAGGEKDACWVAGGPGDTDGSYELSTGTWSASGNLNTARPAAHQGGYGPQTAAMIAGGAPPGTMSEQYNGTVWSTGPSLAVSRNSGLASTIAASSKTGAVMAGSPPHKSETEEYNEETSVLNVKTLTQS